MYKKPELSEIISAVQLFMKDELMPLAKHDKHISYKSVIASNLLSIALREIDTQEIDTDKHNTELSELALIIKTKKIHIDNPTVWNQVKQNIISELRILNPKLADK